MTAAVACLMDHAFDEWRLNRVEIGVGPDNRRSRAIPERLGFREEGVLRSAERFDETDYHDLVLYADPGLGMARDAARARPRARRGSAGSAPRCRS